MKTYEIKPSGTGDYNVYYYIDDKLENIEYHSKDGINGTVKDGYILKVK